jgi:hypothetical protein
MRHDPAVGSVLEGSSGGRGGKGETDLSHPFSATAVTTIIPATTDFNLNVLLAGLD